ncbi:DarT ssDNA thymidine ADP-ribosyltransferase family protein [Pandoraea apista]|uniref:DarT ssDNA thymidine ADP-ribosyltransferase family protein n=1 Tax=Pandoraea apista TaxID=93218 RepID=UPI0009E3E9F4
MSGRRIKAKRREEWGDRRLLKVIEDHMDKALYHMSDYAHADSIRQHGLLSRCEMESRGIAPARPGGNALTRALDEQRGLQDYVFLGFHKRGLMPKDERLDRWRKPLTVYVDPQVVCWHGVLVSLGRSTRSDIFNARRAFWEMDWDIFTQPDLRVDSSPGIHGPARWRKFLDYEVLVPKCIPPEFIHLETAATSADTRDTSAANLAARG